MMELSIQPNATTSVKELLAANNSDALELKDGGDFGEGGDFADTLKRELESDSFVPAWQRQQWLEQTRRAAETDQAYQDNAGYQFAQGQEFAVELPGTSLTDALAAAELPVEPSQPLDEQLTDELLLSDQAARAAKQLQSDSELTSGKSTAGHFFDLIARSRDFDATSKAQGHEAAQLAAELLNNTEAEQAAFAASAAFIESSEFAEVDGVTDAQLPALDDDVALKTADTTASEAGTDGTAASKAKLVVGEQTLTTKIEVDDSNSVVVEAGERVDSAGMTSNQILASQSPSNQAVVPDGLSARVQKTSEVSGSDMVASSAKASKELALKEQASKNTDKASALSADEAALTKQGPLEQAKPSTAEVTDGHLLAGKKAANESSLVAVQSTSMVVETAGAAEASTNAMSLNFVASNSVETAAAERPVQADNNRKKAVTSFAEHLKEVNQQIKTKADKSEQQSQDNSSASDNSRSQAQAAMQQPAALNQAAVPATGSFATGLSAQLSAQAAVSGTETGGAAQHQPVGTVNLTTGHLATTSAAAFGQKATEFATPLALQTPQAANMLSEKVVYQVNQKIQMAEIRLDPEDLGAMQIKVNLQQDQLSLQFTVQQAQAKEALEQHLPKLRELLEQQGLSLGESHIEQRSSQDKQEQSRQFAGGSGTANDEDLVAQTAQVQVKVSDRMVDYYA